MEHTLKMGRVASLPGTVNVKLGNHWALIFSSVPDRNRQVLLSSHVFSFLSSAMQWHPNDPKHITAANSEGGYLGLIHFFLSP